MVKCKPSIICLDNGMQLVAGIINDSENSEVVQTTIPLEITRVKINPTHEALSLRPWIAFTAVEVYEIKQNKIISICALDPQYEEGFYKMTEGYMEDRKESLDMMDAMDDYEPDYASELTIEEFMEQIKSLGKPDPDQIH